MAALGRSRRAAAWAAKSNALAQVSSRGSTPPKSVVTKRTNRGLLQVQGRADEEDPCGVGLILAQRSDRRGFQIGRVLRGGSADRHNALDGNAATSVCVGDLILAINGTPLDSAVDAGLAQHLLSGGAGSEVEMQLSRPSDGEEDGESFSLRLMRGSPSFWHFHEETELLRKELERRRGAYELLKTEFTNCEGSLAKAHAELQDSRRRIAALEVEVNDARQGQSRQRKERGEVEEQHERSKQELAAELERLRLECSRLSKLIGSQEEVHEARRTRDETAIKCESMEFCLQDLAGTLFRSLRQSRVVLKEREAEREAQHRSLAQLAESRERRRNAERQLRQQAHEAQQEKVVLQFAAKALSDQLAHLSAEIDIVSDSLAHATKQQQDHVSMLQQQQADWAANVSERERENAKELANLTRHCNTLAQDFASVQEEHARSLHFADQGARQCAHLDREAEAIVSLMDSLQGSTAGLLMEKARLQAQGELQKADHAKQEAEERAAHARREAEEKARHAKHESDAEAAHMKREEDARSAHAQREAELEDRVRQLVELVREREKVRDVMAQETVERAAAMASLEEQLIEAHCESAVKSKQLEHIKKEAAAELARLLRIVSAVQKQQHHRDTTRQHCGIGVVLVAKRNGGDRSPQSSPTPSADSPGMRDGDREQGHGQFVVHDLIDGFAAATSCALRKGDVVLSIDGVDLAGKTEAMVAEMLHGLRGSRVRLICSARQAFDKPFGVCLRRGKWGPEHAVLTEEEADLVTWSQQQSVATPPLRSAHEWRPGAGIAV